MNKTIQERTRRGTLKKKAARLAKRGLSLPPEDQKWCDAYDATAKARNKPKAAPTAKPEPAKPAPTHRWGSQQAPPLEDAPPTTVDTPREPAKGSRVLDFDAPSPRELAPANDAPPGTDLATRGWDHDPSGPACTIEDCPHCKQVAIVGTCGTTNKPVYAPPDEDTAETYGEMVFGGISFLAALGRAFVGRPRIDVEVSEKEARKMKKGMQKLVHRRANALGAIEDVVLVLSASGSYGIRSLNAGGPDASSPR